MNTDIFTTKGKFLMLALDHRGSFEKMIKPFSVNKAIETKVQIINSVYDQMTGVLIDKDYGYQGYLKLTKQEIKPFLLPLEESGYTQEAGERITNLKYTVEELKELGATGAKLLIYFNPNYKSALKQMETAKKVVEECKNKNFPIFLEIVNYENEYDDYKVVRSLERFIKNKIFPDVYKLEYPGNLDNAKKITQMLKEYDIPWILLTRGSEFDNFVQQLDISLQGGCSGFLAGRGLWQELPEIKNEQEKLEFLQKTLPQRFEKIAELTLSY